MCIDTRRKTKKKVSLNHVNETFNQHLQADFTIVYLVTEKYEVLNIIDAGTRYGERTIARCRDARTM